MEHHEGQQAPLLLMPEQGPVEELGLEPELELELELELERASRRCRSISNPQSWRIQIMRPAPLPPLVSPIVTLPQAPLQ